jgi:hypothetical protein
MIIARYKRPRRCECVVFNALRTSRVSNGGRVLLGNVSFREPLDPPGQPRLGLSSD